MFKIGDRVRCIDGVIKVGGIYAGGGRGGGWELDKIYTVKSINNNGRDLLGRNIYFFKECECGVIEDYLELVEDQKFKVGDKVNYMDFRNVEIGCIHPGIAYMKPFGEWMSGDGGSCKEHGTCMGYLLDGLVLSEDQDQDQDKACNGDIINNLGEYFKMNKIKTFVKNALLSGDEKLLRKHGLKTECGDYTEEAQQIIINDMCKEHESRLIEVAKGLESEEEN